MRILVAEDDLVSRKVLLKFLEKWGHETVSASDGAEAWKRFRADSEARPAPAGGRFAVVISDWMMPNLDGLDLVKRIRASQAADPGRGYVYVMMLTAKAGRENLVEGLGAGADDFLTKPFDQEELRVRLRTAERIIALEAGLADRNRRLEAANADLKAVNGRMRRELEAAAKVQRALLPETPSVEGAAFSWIFRPCEELAGDLPGVLRLDARHVAAYVLDVSGHGVPAALLSVQVAQALARLADPDSPLRRRVGAGSGQNPAPPAAVARELFRQFPFDPVSGQYFTLAYATLDLSTRELRCVSAGHPRPILVSAAGTQPPTPLPVSGFPIGLLEGVDSVDYAEDRRILAPGDRLLFYSDGLTDAIDPGKRPFGEDRLLAALAEPPGRPLPDALQHLVARVDSHTAGGPPLDDVTVLGVEVG